MDKIQKVNIKDIDLDNTPIRHEVLSEEFIERVKRYKGILGEVERMSIEETIDGFKKDTHPESELEVWEGIARDYKLRVSGNEQLSAEEKKKIFSELLYVSMGGDPKDLNKG